MQEVIQRTHRDVFVVLPKLMGSRHHLPLRDPLFQVVHLPLQLAQAEMFLKLGTALLSQVLQAGIQLVHLALPEGDPLTVGKGTDTIYTTTAVDWCARMALCSAVLMLSSDNILRLTSFLTAPHHNSFYLMKGGLTFESLYLEKLVGL